jgi:hypothetical protein
MITATALLELARLATIMVDGDLCQRIVKPQSIREMFQPNPRDKWSASDNYNVDQPAYIQTKKTLIRLAKTVDFPVDLNLWMLLPKPNKIHIVIRQSNEISQFWTWGTFFQDMHPAMKKVVDTGQRVTVSEKPGLTSILTPVKNSLGDIVGIIEVAAAAKLDPNENVK